MEPIDAFKGILIMSLFYSFAITSIAYYMPPNALNHVSMFSNINEQISIDSVSQEVEDSLQRQTNLPLIELGALVFYSGNILIDLLLNFAFALPQMLVMLIAGILYIFPAIPLQLTQSIKLFSTSILMIMYMIGILQLLTNIRATGKVI